MADNLKYVGAMRIYDSLTHPGSKVDLVILKNGDFTLVRDVDWSDINERNKYLVNSYTLVYDERTKHISFEEFVSKNMKPNMEKKEIKSYRTSWEMYNHMSENHKKIADMTYIEKINRCAQCAYFNEDTDKSVYNYPCSSCIGSPAQLTCVDEDYYCFIGRD